MTVAESGLGAVALGTEDAVRAVAAVKARLRSTNTGEDGLIETLCHAALGLAEQFTGAAMLVREMNAVLSVGQGWQRLPGCPVRAITGIEALAAGGETAMAVATDAYAFDIDAASDGWVRVARSVDAGRVRVTYSAGIAEDWDALPAPLAQGVVLLAAHLFDGRGAEAPPPAAVAALWRPWRRMRLMAARASA